jgi:hypothetical protein
MKTKYYEGPEAFAKFEAVARKVFRAPKSSAKSVQKKHTVRKAKKLNKGY